MTNLLGGMCRREDDLACKELRQESVKCTAHALIAACLPPECDMASLPYSATMTRFFPAFFALYMALSARAISVS